MTLDTYTLAIFSAACSRCARDGLLIVRLPAQIGKNRNPEICKLITIRHEPPTT